MERRFIRIASFLSHPAKKTRDLRGVLKAVRGALGRRLERLLIGWEPVTIISDDCWGGEFCRSLGCAYTTPLAGAFVEPRDYLTFLENLDRPDAFDLRPATGAVPYPIGRTPYATIHFQHAKSWHEVERIFPRRVARINGRRLLHKIDFGKPGYRQSDVDRWNALARPHALALLPPRGRVGLDLTHVYQGVTVPRWVGDGIAMFHLSRRSFDFHYWIRTGRLRKSWLNRGLNFLFWDAWMPSELTQRWNAARMRRGSPKYSAADSTAAARARRDTSPPCGARAECPARPES